MPTMQLSDIIGVWLNAASSGAKKYFFFSLHMQSYSQRRVNTHKGVKLVVFPFNIVLKILIIMLQYWFLNYWYKKNKNREIFVTKCFWGHFKISQLVAIFTIIVTLKHQILIFGLNNTHMIILCICNRVYLFFFVHLVHVFSPKKGQNP